LIAEGNGCLAQPFPSIPQIVGEFLRQSRFSGRPTVVLFSVLDPLLAVVALSTGHTSELYWRLSRNWHARLQLRNQWRINRSDSSSGSSKLQKIGASPKGTDFALSRNPQVLSFQCER
jgi:hypothetical protein